MAKVSISKHLSNIKSTFCVQNIRFLCALHVVWLLCGNLQWNWMKHTILLWIHRQMHSSTHRIQIYFHTIVNGIIVGRHSPNSTQIHSLRKTHRISLHIYSMRVWRVWMHRLCVLKCFNISSSLQVNHALHSVIIYTLICGTISRVSTLQLQL